MRYSWLSFFNPGSLIFNFAGNFEILMHSLFGDTIEEHNSSTTSLRHSSRRKSIDVKRG